MFRIKQLKDELQLIANYFLTQSIIANFYIKIPS